ncbi:MAG: protein-methionine-sulfoxide reductase heme-binding subunit MsrQ [Planktomarina sp.]
MVQSINGVLRRVPTWVVYLVGLIPLAFLINDAVAGNLGVDPTKKIERALGDVSIKLIIIGLTVTPLLKFARINLIKFRRAFGLLAFLYVTLHLLVWLVLDVQLISQIQADIIKRLYITVGMAAFVLMIPLAITSNIWSIRKLGPLWRKLHKATYVIALLGAVHFVMQAKGLQLEPLMYLGGIILLLGLRLVR